MNLAPAATGKVERSTNEVVPAIQRIPAAKSEAMVQIGAYKACATFIRLARAKGYAGNFYNVSLVGTQALSDELGAMARGVAVS
ncbi:hypothetical protein [Hydrogenophaga sp.]|uniref:hypothetical protein n=1 Tax=Hydrogenophaga sp. TaxID=1904254 RepID=UPI0025BC6B55|nr:hypothetical protein [Hydrogenophaga sp.]